jgi:uncharacterized protein (DUF1810 family)
MTFIGSNRQGRISRVRCLVDIGAEILDEASNYIQKILLGCGHQGCMTIIRGLVNIGTELID